MKLYDTRSRSIRTLRPLSDTHVSFYACGPTVYDYTHIGHARKYTMDDVLKRTLMYLGYEVKHVMNITDVGHLTGDDDSGEDKLEKGAKKTGKTVWDVAQFYTDFFEQTMKDMNILPPSIQPKATAYIDEMIAMIKNLEKKGFTYETNEAIYFDISKYSKYGALSGQKIEEKKKAVRKEINIDPGKKHQADFALWFKRAGRFHDHAMHWESPWGDGFPGWHIECSAMSSDLLGPQIDIHSGGIDHVPVHHENEIAQSECATGESPFVQFWVHHNFLRVEGEKMSKSLQNFYTLEDLKKKGVDPMALRLLFLQTHYRQEMNFTWESIHAAQEAYQKIQNYVRALSDKVAGEKSTRTGQGKEYQKDFTTLIGDDLQVPQAVALMWKMLKDTSFEPDEKLSLLFDFDRVFGLNLKNNTVEDIPQEVIDLAEKRKQAKEEKDYAAADALRNQIQTKGYVIEDKQDTYILKRQKS